MKLLRAGLVFLAAVHGVLGLWTLVLPRSFYDGIPTVDAYPPFNEHLFRDYGGLNLAIAVVLGAAALYLERRLVFTALIAYLIVTATHFGFHATHLGHMTPAESVYLLVSLAVNAALPIGLLVLARRQLARPGQPSL